jgi:hypothetical protein
LVIAALQRSAQRRAALPSDRHQSYAAFFDPVTRTTRCLLIQVKCHLVRQVDNNSRRSRCFGTASYLPMSSYEFAARSRDRAADRLQSETGLSALMRLQERAQFVRLGNRYAIAALGTGFVYVVAKGVVGIECAVHSGIRAVTTLLYPGDVLVPELQAPLLGLALTSQRPAEFWKLTTAAFAEESTKDAQLWQTIFLRLNAQNARSQLHIAAMSGLNSEERIAAFLIEIGSRIGTPAGSSVTFELPLSRYSIADYLSLNADTVSRTFSALVAAGIIERRGRFQISIRDWQALAAKCPLSDAITKLHAAGKIALIR